MNNIKSCMCHTLPIKKGFIILECLNSKDIQIEVENSPTYVRNFELVGIQRMKFAWKEWFQHSTKYCRQHKCDARIVP